MAEEKELTLEELKAEIEKVKAENEKLRTANTNASADASKYKKQLQEKMSAEEKAKAESDEALKKMQEELASLRKDKAILDRTARFLTVGFTEDLAKTAASAWENGEEDKVFDSFKTFITERDKSLEAEKVKNTPKPGSGASSTTVTKEQFEGMSYTEMAKLYAENPELYKQLKEK